MKVFTSNNPNVTLKDIVRDITEFGKPANSRNGMTISYDEPVCIRHVNPAHRVIWLKSRNANPFFHLFEFVWMLAGRNDVRTLSAFNANMKSYSDDGEIFNAPYGYRLRKHFGIDQIKSVIEQLKKDPSSRQAVALLWDSKDLIKQTKDKACNLELVFKLRDTGKLDMTVFNRSNDLIWGALGANLVHMSLFHEYVATEVGVPMGAYEQISNCMHVYTDGLPGDIYRAILNQRDEGEVYCGYYPCDSSPSMKGIDEDVEDLFYHIGNCDTVVDMASGFMQSYRSEFFEKLFIPMMLVYLFHKLKRDDVAMQILVGSEIPEDWKRASHNWLELRRH